MLKTYVYVQRNSFIFRSIDFDGFHCNYNLYLHRCNSMPYENGRTSVRSIRRKTARLRTGIELINSFFLPLALTLTSNGKEIYVQIGCSIQMVASPVTNCRMQYPLFRRRKETFLSMFIVHEMIKI